MKKIKQLIRQIIPWKVLKIYFLLFKEKRIKRWVNSLIYYGKEFYCPCCNKTFKQFLNAKYKKQYAQRFINHYKNTMCPNCGSAPRQRIICHYLNENKSLILNNKGKTDILIFAAEYSIKKWMKKNRYQFVTVDLNNLLADVLLDIQDTHFASNTWSLIICNHVLQHVENHTAALKELKRILKPEGVLMLSVATNRNLDTTYEDPAIVTNEQRLELYGEEDYLRIFGNDFEKLLINIGFSVAIIDGKYLPERIMPVIGPAVQDDNRIYICKKN